MKTEISRFARIALTALAATAVVAALAACTKGDPAPAPTPTPDPDPVKNEVTVQDAICTTVTTTVDGNEYIYTYVIPEVTCTVQSPFVKEIQQTLDTIEATMVEPAIEALQAKDEPGIVSVDYTAKAVGDIISICVTIINNYDGIPSYYVWNVKADGTQATDAELLAAKGVTQDQYVAKITDTLGYFINGNYEELENTVGKDMADEVRRADQKTLSEDNIKATPLYVNDEGHLAAIAKVFTIAGAGYKVYFLDLGF